MIFASFINGLLVYVLAALVLGGVSIVFPSFSHNMLLSIAAILGFVVFAVSALRET